MSAATETSGDRKVHREFDEHIIDEKAMRDAHLQITTTTEEGVSTTTTAAAAAAVEAHFPDGGLKAWMTVLGGWLAFIATIGFLTGASVFQSYYTETLPDVTASDVAWIGSVQIWGCFFFGVLAGELSDKYGPKLPIGIGGVVTVFGVMMSSISKKYYQILLSQGFCLSLGLGLSFTPSLAVQSQWFLKRRGFVVGLVMSGQNVGGIIWPVLINRLLNYHGVSLAWTLRTIGFMQLVLLAVATLLVQARFPRGHVPHEPISVQGALAKYFTNKRTVLFTLGMFIMNLGIYVPWFFVTPYGMELGASASLAFYYAAILNGGAFFGCYALGIIADSGLGFFNSLTITVFACAIAAFGWIGTKTNAGTIVWVVIYGLLSGAIQAIFSPCLSLLAPTPEVIGIWNGVCITIISFAVLATGPVAGKLLQDGGYTDYLPMQLFTGVCLIVAAVLFLIDRISVSRKARV